MYADDLMIICPDQSKLESAINIIKKWSADNSMILNNNKSGIIEFRPRRSKPSKNFQIGKQNPNICGIPIVSQYRYLGLMLNPTLHLNQQINIVFKKAQQIYSRICPFLFSADADTRKNLWQIFILPQIEFLLPLLANENTQYLRKKVNQVILGPSSFLWVYQKIRQTELPNYYWDTISYKGLIIFKLCPDADGK